nr:formylglycine-generating enzyme family protein [Methylomarinum sp. Ch1-1]MDP4520031.1 formylglycine-generating enzyme family protein [Methylomarinum sp. Ch1-1]
MASLGRLAQACEKEVRDDEPVTCVSFYDINQYIAWLNQTTGQHYRLPTEAEWEYAARAGRNTSYFWGNNADLSCRYANAADLSEFSGVGWPIPHQCIDQYFFAAPVKQFLPNQFGLYDMLGNVWEWTCSQFLNDYQGQEQRCLNGDENNNALFIAVRGGGWNADPARVRAAYRNWHSPWVRLATWGFRLVKDNDRR